MLVLLGRKMYKEKGCRKLSTHHAELNEVFWFMSCLCEQNVLSVRFELDCANLVKMIEEPIYWPAFRSGMQYYRTFREHFAVFY